MEDSMSITCGNCGEVLIQEAAYLQSPPCPKCGSTKRDITLCFEDEAPPMHDMLEGRVGPKVRIGPESKRKRYPQEFMAGDDLCKESGKWMDKTRTLDRENNRYFEMVRDPETGEVIHRCEEPLDKHMGHGSDKAPSVNVDSNSTEP